MHDLKPDSVAPMLAAFAVLGTVVGGPGPHGRSRYDSRSLDGEPEPDHRV
jgi:hypothetical protein